MDDLISRKSALDALEWKWAGKAAIDAIKNLPAAEPTLYGYKIEHLAYIATVMEKEGVTAEYAVRTFDDIGRMIKMIIEEAWVKVEEALK